MASQSGGMTGPFWSAESRMHYWYDQLNDLIVWQGGQQMPRPASIPRSTLLPPNLQYAYTEPLSTEQSEYTARRPTDEMTGSRFIDSNPNVDTLTYALGDLGVGGSGRAVRPPQGPPIQSASRSLRQQPETSFANSADGVITKLTDLPEGKIVQAFDPRNEVRTKFQTGPTKDITDPALFQNESGRGATRMLLGTGSEGQTEQLFSTYQVRPSPRKFFTVGKVFMILWSEPAGQTLVTAGVSARTSGTAMGRYGEMVFSKVRRFVVIREAQTYCSALPIATYGSQGVGKPNVTKSEHAIIYTGRSPPSPMKSEEPIRGELGMRPEPIRVDPDDREDKLDPRSRIDFGKVHTIQHNIKVKSYGRVNDKSLLALVQQFSNCWYSTSQTTVKSAPAPPNPSRGLMEAPASTGARWESVSTGRRSHPPGEGGSSGSQGRGRDAETGPSRSSATEIARRQELQRQQYWAAIEKLERSGYSRERAMQILNARLAQKMAAKDQDGEDDDDEEDEDD